MADTSLRIPGGAIGGPLAPPAPTKGARRGQRELIRRLGRAISPVPAAVARSGWSALWLPYWFGSDVPAPELPVRDRRPSGTVGLAGEQVVQTLDRLARRLWLLWIMSVLVRGAWLGGLVGIGWLILERLGGPAFDSALLLRISAALFALGVVFAALIRPTRRRTARTLDRSFRLHERMTTALENLGQGVPPPGVRAEIVYLQMADAANVVAELRRHPAFGLRLPLREVVLALACILLLASLYFLRGVGGGIPDLATAGVPPFTPAASRPRTDDQVPNPAALPPGSEQAPTTAEVQERAARSNEAQRDLSTLGQALDNHSVTSQAADAIARGDYDAAADELRDLAANASQLEPETREALADDLDAAADQMSEGSEELAQATRDAADGLRQGGEPAQQGLENLGDEVQETGEEVVSQQELADQMAAAQAAESSGTQSQTGEQGESGDQQTGEAGAEGDNRRPPSGQQDGSPGEGEPGEPGSEGSEAQQGQSGATQPQDAADRGNNPGRSQNQGQGEQRGRSGRSASQPGQPGMPQPGEGQPGDPGSPADAQGEPGEGQQEGGDPQSGAGAGSGETQDAAGEQQGAQTGQEQAPGEGLPAEERVNTAEQPEGGEPTGDPRAADDAIQLDRTGGQGIQTGNDSGSASAGSGTGVMTASGDATQEEVGEAGPDSNHVPPGYEGIVTDFFSDPEDDA